MSRVDVRQLRDHAAKQHPEIVIPQEHRRAIGEKRIEGWNRSGCRRRECRPGRIIVSGRTEIKVPFELEIDQRGNRDKSPAKREAGADPQRSWHLAWSDSPPSHPNLAK